MKTGENTGGMKIIEKLAAKFKVELTAEIGDSFEDFLRLHRNILVVVKGNDVHGMTPHKKFKKSS
jgi:hypothetical protein